MPQREGGEKPPGSKVAALAAKQFEARRDAVKTGLVMNRDGTAPIGRIDNIEHILGNDPRWQGVLGFCEFSFRVMKRKPPPFDQGAVTGEWADEDTARTRIWLAREYAMGSGTADVEDATLVVAKAQPFHPVREYLEGLAWDGNERLGCWLTDYLGAEFTPYSSLVGSRWMISAVARAMRSPVKVDHVLILYEPNQGAGKSTAFKVIGGEWFSDTHFTIGDKDAYQQLQGVWICELAELDAFNKAESTRAKAFFSAMTDRYRPSYGRRARDFPRQFLFCGTTNVQTHLRDPTGNRRYWPVTVGAFDLEALAHDRDQLWAEALHLYRQGAIWWPQPGEESAMVAAEQDQYRQGDAWEDLVLRWVDDAERRRTEHFTLDEIMAGALQLDAGHMKPPEQKRVVEILHSMGWRQRRITSKDSAGRTHRPRVYVRPPEAKASGVSG